VDADEREQQAESEAPASAGSQQVNIQVAVVSSADKAVELQAKLRAAGFASYTMKAPSGLIRIKIQCNKSDSTMVQDRLAKLGL
jgi:cell division septation protein DedD